MKVQLLKMITGEEIIASMVLTDRTVRIKNPVRVVVMPQKTYDPKGGIQVGFAPWAEFGEETEFLLDRSHIVAIMTPVKMLLNQYNAMFSGIITPNSGLVVPQ
jgi:hypothetical protein